MPEIMYVRGDATAPRGKGVKLIAHVCNDLGGRGRGFVLAVSRRWPEPEAAYRRWHRERAGNDFGLGAAQFVQVGPYVWVANVVGQRGTRTGSKGVPVQYEAIDTGLGLVTERAVERGRRFICHGSVAVSRAAVGPGSSR
jgi:O-acetyl-ADP-ribose deacetylase (regulator of RNase III)